MKTLTILAATLLASSPFVAVSAATLDPITYGTTYCSSRRSGLGFNEATDRAVLLSIDHGRTAIKLNDGVDLDVVLSTESVKRLCPEYL